MTGTFRSASVPAVMVRIASAVVGRVLATVFGAVAVARRDRPLHPRGATYAARVTMHGNVDSGVPWLDNAGSSPVQIRFSRATGLPWPWPDIYGAALHVPADVVAQPEGADLLFASTGDSAVGRFVLIPRRRAGRGPLTTLLPLRTTIGPTLFRLMPRDVQAAAPGVVGDRYRLSYAVGRHPWTTAGEIVIGAQEDPHLDRRRHDPVLHTLPGTQQYSAVSALREPSYRAARRVPAS